MICADFLAGASLDSGQPAYRCKRFRGCSHFYQASRTRSSLNLSPNRSNKSNLAEHMPLRLNAREYGELRGRVLRRDSWRCQFCGSMTNLEVDHQRFPSHSGRIRKTT
jgi:5-methylcytosine-specific restriction endonuclease McrA